MKNSIICFKGEILEMVWEVDSEMLENAINRRLSIPIVIGT